MVTYYLLLLKKEFKEFKFDQKIFKFFFLMLLPLYIGKNWPQEETVIK